MNGCVFVGDPGQADDVVFLTTGVTGIGEEYYFSWLDALKPYWDKLIAVGLLHDMNPGRFFKEYKGRSVPLLDPGFIDNFFPEFKIKFRGMDEVNSENEVCSLPHQLYENYGFVFERGIPKLCQLRQKTKTGFLHRIKNNLVKRYFVDKNKTFFIRVTTGCLGDCSYCCLRRAFGALKSKPIEDILKEFKKGLKKGYSIFKLVSSDAGAYGLDIGKDFPYLLDALVKEARGRSINLQATSINPRWLVRYRNELKYFFEKKILTSFFCSIQSGNSRILKLMRRHYTADEIVEVMRTFRSVYPELYVPTEVIVGFPSETEEEFKDTMRCLKEASFDRVITYEFYPKVGVDASGMPTAVPQEIVNRRREELMAFCRKESILCVYGV